MAEPRIAVYGATGYTGRLVVEELRRRGLDAVVCGRSAQRLAAVAGPYEARAAPLDDPGALRAAFAGCTAVVNCAGPFTLLGEPVVQAALAAGVHYVDTTGEQPFMQRIFERFDAAARAAGVALVPGAGFDYVPGDLLAALVARGRQPLDELVVAYAVSGFGMSRGTMRSALEMLKGGDLEYTGGRWHPAGRPVAGERFCFGEPIGCRPVARYPGGEVVTVPRHVDVRDVRVRITASTFAPHPVLTPAVPTLTAALQPLLRTPVSALLRRGIDRLPEGPSEEARRAARFRIEAVARGEDHAVSRGSVEGRDVYGLTAVTAVGLALAVASSDATGTLAPAQAVDPEGFLDELGAHGVSHRVERAAIPARV